MRCLRTWLSWGPSPRNRAWVASALGRREVAVTFGEFCSAWLQSPAEGVGHRPEKPLLWGCEEQHLDAFLPFQAQSRAGGWSWAEARVRPPGQRFSMNLKCTPCLQNRESSLGRAQGSWGSWSVLVLLLPWTSCVMLSVVLTVSEPLWPHGDGPHRIPPVLSKRLQAGLWELGVQVALRCQRSYGSWGCSD